MTARLTQLLARYVAAALTAVAGALGLQAESGETDSLSLALASAIVAAVLYLFDLMIHKAATGGITKPAGTSKAAILLILLLPLAACNTPGERYVAQREAVTTAQTVVPDLTKQGVISEDDLDVIVPLIWTARDAVNLSYAYLPEGGPEFDSNLTKAADAIANLRSILRNKQETE